MCIRDRAKTSAKLTRFHEDGGLFISILTDPTAGGTTASFAVSYTHLRAHETVLDLVCRLLLEKKNKNQDQIKILHPLILQYPSY